MSESYEQITAKILEPHEAPQEEPKEEEPKAEKPKRRKAKPQVKEEPKAEEPQEPPKKGKLQEKVECPDCGKRVSRSTLKYNKHTCYTPPPPPPPPKRSTAALVPSDPTQVVLDNYRKIKAAQIDSRKQKYATWLESF